MVLALLCTAQPRKGPLAMGKSGQLCLACSATADNIVVSKSGAVGWDARQRRCFKPRRQCKDPKLVVPALGEPGYLPRVQDDRMDTGAACRQHPTPRCGCDDNQYNKLSAYRGDVQKLRSFHVFQCGSNRGVNTSFQPIAANTTSFASTSARQCASFCATAHKSVQRLVEERLTEREWLDRSPEKFHQAQSCSPDTWGV
jgi:hypothetical protein